MSMTTQQCGQIYKTFSVGDDASSRAGEDLSYGVFSFLTMMRLWFACTVENMTNRGMRYLRAIEAQALQDAADIASGKTRAPALIPEDARAPEAPKIMLSRSAKRMLARGMPASRRYGWFRYASNRTLSGTQFFELVARLSVNGRMGVYKLEHRKRLCQLLAPRLSASALPAQLYAVPMGLSPSHLWPD